MRLSLSLLVGTLALGLLPVGCGDSGGGGGTGGGGVVPTGATIVYEGDAVTLATVNVCNAVTDGTETMVAAGTSSELGAANQVMLTFLQDEDFTLAASVFAELEAGATLEDVPSFVGGLIQLADFPADMRQLIMEGGACALTYSFVRTVELFPGTDGQEYRVTFECPSVPYVWIDIDTSATGDTGTLTDLSGEFECIMTFAEG